MLTHAQPPLTETLPGCCLPLARLLTTEQQMTQVGILQFRFSYFITVTGINVRNASLSCSFAWTFVCLLLAFLATYKFLKSCDIVSHQDRVWANIALLALHRIGTINFLRQVFKTRSTSHLAQKFCQKLSRTQKFSRCKPLLRNDHLSIFCPSF